MEHKRYIIICDESEYKGKFFSNFYGGIILEASKQQKLEKELQDLKDEIGIFQGEMKWERITTPYVNKYITFVDKIFDILERGDFKIRIMFTQNRNIPLLRDYQIGDDYFLLYYQFLKHAFGLQFSVPVNGSASAAVLLDDIPKHPAKLDEFKRYLSGLSNYPIWSRAKFSIDYQDITDVDSKNHNILQALDIILGSMQSRLNEKHTRVQPPLKRRSKRARAKALVYERIKERIFRIYPRFNVGVTTATKTGTEDRFHNPYRHWLFVPNNARIDPKLTKKIKLKKSDPT